ncbi:MAG: ATP-binding cassette domain-containing protein [Conexibacter sp.]
MPLLVADRVSKFLPGEGRGDRERTILRDVSLTVPAGEVVAVWGRRRSGRSTLLRVLAGVEPPSEGTVTFDGVDLRRRPMLGARGGIGYCHVVFARAIGETVLDQVAAPLLAGAMSRLQAEVCARRALRRVGALELAELRPDELDQFEALHVGIARGLVTDSRLLVLDEPTAGAYARVRDAVLDLLRSFAREDGVAIVMAVEEAANLAGADRALTIDRGELHGERPVAPEPIVQLRDELA